MKTGRLMKRGLRLEELEGRLTLSVVPGLPTAAAFPPIGHGQAAAQTAKVNATIAPTATLSSNWSGYAVAAAANSVSNVAGTWAVPTASTSTNGYSSVWVGIDGYSSSTVEQVGTDSNVVNGKATYYAWYEMYPSDSVTISSIAVKAGDSITASVAYVNNQFVLTITDNSDHQSYTKSFAASGESRSSAEWIVEAPSSNYGVLPLANFGKATFTNIYATIGGTTAPIDAWQSYSINIESGSRLETSTTALSDSQTTLGAYSGLVSSFSVAYDAAGASTTTTSGGGSTTTAPSPGSGTGTTTTTSPSPGSGSGSGWGGWGRGWGGWGRGWGEWSWRQPDVVSVGFGDGLSLSQLASRGDHVAKDQFFASSQLLSLLNVRL